MSFRAILVGASGLVGSELLSELIASSHISNILLISRKHLSIDNPNVRQLILNFDHFEEHLNEIEGDILFSCIGTTKSKTPDASNYRKIDYEYPLSLARLALKKGILQFHLVSSIGADASSGTFYLKLKGELENELKKSGLPSLHIYQPSFLTGKRSEMRLSDKIISPIMRLMNPILTGPLKKYRSISAKTVAKAMLNQSLKDLKGTFTYSSLQIEQLA